MDFCNPRKAVPDSPPSTPAQPSDPFAQRVVAAKNPAEVAPSNPNELKALAKSWSLSFFPSPEPALPTSATPATLNHKMPSHKTDEKTTVDLIALLPDNCDTALKIGADAKPGDAATFHKVAKGALREIPHCDPTMSRGIGMLELICEDAEWTTMVADMAFLKRKDGSLASSGTAAKGGQDSRPIEHNRASISLAGHTTQTPTFHSINGTHLCPKSSSHCLA